MGVKGKISQILLAAGIMAVSGFSVGATMLLIANERTRLARAETLGTGQISSVQILQAGTGASVTIRGETLDENDYGTDDTTRRTILNNNVVRYRVNYTASGGWIKLVFTMPVNNYINAASVSGCDSDDAHKSEVKALNIDGKTSITTNQAVCYINAGDSMVSSSWDITTKPWGGNGDMIIPTVAMNDVDADVTIDPITVVGRLNYGVVVGSSGGSTHFDNGYTSFNLDIGVYMKTDGQANNLGIEPIKDGNYSLDINMSELPVGWYIKYSTIGVGLDVYIGNQWGVDSGESGKITLSKPRDAALHVETTGAITAIAKCAHNEDGSGQWRVASSTRCTQSLVQANIYVPITDIPRTSKAYKVQVDEAQLSGESEAQEADITDAAYNYRLTSQVSGSMTTYVDDTTAAPTDEVGWWDDHHYYIGQIVPLRAAMYSNSAFNYYSSDNVGCIAWDRSKFLLYDVNNVGFDDRTRNNKLLVSLDAASGIPDVSEGCGEYGSTVDSKGNVYSDAFSAVGTTVDLSIMRLESERYSLEAVYWLSHIEYKVLDNVIDGKSKEMTYAVASTTEWNSFNNMGVRNYTMIPGAVKSQCFVRLFCQCRLSCNTNDHAANL